MVVTYDIDASYMERVMGLEPTTFSLGSFGRPSAAP